MPIQVISTFLELKLAPLDLVSAGPDVFPLCDTNITLTAEVDFPTNTPGYDILWEQLSGTPVILSNTNQLTTSYTQILNDETDKTFRITISGKDLPDMVDEVTVYATPTSFTATTYPSDPKHQVPAVPVDRTTFDVLPSGTFPDPAGVINPEVVVTPAFLISWEAPTDPLYSPFMTNMALYENDVFVQNYLPTATLEYDGGPEIYYVITDYIVNSQPSSAQSLAVDFAETVIPTTKVIDDSMQVNNFATPDVVINYFINSVESQESLQVSGYSNSENKVTQLINSVIPNTIENQPSGFTVGESLITRTDPGGIGGG